MKTVFLMTKAHDLSREEEGILLDKYNADTPRAIKDLIEWQRERYANPVDAFYLCTVPPYHIIKAVIQMLYERELFGYPYKMFNSKSEYTRKLVDVWIIPPKKPRRRGRGYDGTDKISVW